MSSICLRNWQILALQQGRLGAVVVPCRDQTPDAYKWVENEDTFPGGKQYTGWVKDIKRLSLLIPAKPPFRPGQQVKVRETWGVGCRPDPGAGFRDGLEYRADEFWLGEHDDLPLYDVEPPEHIDLSDYRMGWRSASTMPLWASRYTLPIAAVRPVRAGDVTEEECWVMGIAEADGLFDKEIPAMAKQIGCSFEDAKPLFACLWNATHKAQWHPDLWLWLLTLDRPAQTAMEKPQ